MRNCLTLLILVVPLLASCVTGPGYDSAQFSPEVTPAEVAKNYDAWEGSRVLWGGLIVGTSNEETGTVLQLLAYPLLSNQRPDTEAVAQGRFLIVDEQFLEPVDYSEGRMITVTGQISELRTGQVGSADYEFPVVKPVQMHLWSRDSERNKPVIHFGIGVGVGF